MKRVLTIVWQLVGIIFGLIVLVGLVGAVIGTLVME